MINKNVILIISGLFLSGCLAESMTLVQSGIGASQGRAIQSAVSPALSFGVKQATGKFPVEHIIVREKERLAKKATDFEKQVISNYKTKISGSKKLIKPLKNNLDNKLAKINSNFIKVKTFAAENFKHNPRFSYKVR